MKNIKFSKNSISVKDIENVKSVINSGWLTHGKFTNLFEKEFSKYTNSKFCVTVHKNQILFHETSCILWDVESRKFCLALRNLIKYLTNC